MIVQANLGLEPITQMVTDGFGNAGKSIIKFAVKKYGKAKQQEMMRVINDMMLAVDEGDANMECFQERYTTTN